MTLAPTGRDQGRSTLGLQQRSSASCRRLDQIKRVEAFRELHGLDAKQPFVLPNAWDALSARVMEEAGAAAIGKTSAEVAWGLGLPDSQRVDRATMIEVISRICRSILIRVTADVGSGYGRARPRT